MLWRSISLLAALWPGMLIGTGLVLAGTWTGWRVGRNRSHLAARAIAWWVTRVILPMLMTRSWFRRAATIFVNNSLVLAVLVALGGWPYVGLAAVAVLGINLGIALRVLSSVADGFLDPGPDGPAYSRRRIVLGVVLNLLEPPAIVAALGLSIGQESIPAGSVGVWQTFGLLVVPTLAIAAGGEALWLGAFCTDRADRDAAAPEEEEPVPPV